MASASSKADLLDRRYGSSRGVGALAATLRAAFGGVAGRVLLSMALVGLPVTAIAGWLVYSAANADQIEHAGTNLANNVETAVTRFEQNVSSVRDAALFLAHLPSVAGIVAAGEAGNAEVEAAWKDRLTVVFTDLLASRLDYFQVRFIGAEQDGREIVRVDRHPDGTVAPVAEADLQSKGGRSYFVETAALPDGGIYISPINLNREFGEIETPHRPTYRVASPVYDDEGAFRGIVVINVSADQAFVEAASSVIGEATLTIANEDGDYLFGPDESRNFGFEFGQRYLIQDDLPELAPLFDGDVDALTTRAELASGDALMAARRAYFDPDRPDRFVVVASSLPVGVVTLAGGNLYTTVGVVMLVLMIAGAIQFAFLMRTVVAPMREVRGAVHAFGTGDRSIELGAAAARHDEIGDLAQSFEEMMARISEREAELVEKAEALSQSNQELSQFAYVASHDLQEPLRMVASYLELLSSRYSDKLDAEADEFIGYAVDGAARMKRLINDLLVYSRSNNRELSMSSVDANEVVDRALATYQTRIEEAGAEVVVDDLPEIAVDEAQVERLFGNLIDNALKYRSEAEPKIRISARREGRHVAFEIADNGIGIDPKFAGKVFEIFTRLHGRDRYPGTGIGLASCRRVVERHGGKIWVTPAEGGGSVFHFTLPAATTARKAV